MSLTRVPGAEQPGWNWGIFTARVPFLHVRPEWPELFQGFFMAGATGLALVPILTLHFGLSYESAIALVLVNTVIISSAPILFGEPYAPGWITPALPLALVYIAAYETPVERIQAMTAASLDLAVLLLFLGITGLGRRFMAWLPPVIKCGILLGAAISAFKRILVDTGPGHLFDKPVSTSLAIGVCLLLTFSVPIQRARLRHRWIGGIARWGLLPGFVIAALVGPLAGEIRYEVEWGILLPPLGELFRSVSPFAIGWPSPRMFLEGAPLAFVAYVLVFGDLVTGEETLRAAAAHRPDERVRTDATRTHVSLGVRTAAMGLFTPFFSTQGVLWTGAHIIILQRWKEGRHAMDSLYGGLSSYYVFGLPVFYLVLPILTGLKPLMGVALALTLALTGFACAQLALGMPRSAAERGAAALAAAGFAFCDPWIALPLAFAAAFALVGPTAFASATPPGGCEGGQDFPPGPEQR